MCSRVGKPSSTQAEALHKLLPFSSASYLAEHVNARKQAFDPTLECVFSTQKKKAACNRGTNLTIMLVNDYSKGVPIKKKKTQLQDDYLVKKVEMFRTTSAEQVQARIKQQFALKNFQFLQVHGKKLNDSYQLVNGDELIESAPKRHENRVYITKLPDGDSVCDFYCYVLI